MDVNCAGASDRRPIHRAAGAGHLDICEYLVSKGALVNQPDKSGRTSLHWAAIAGYANVVKYLLDNGCDIMAQTAGSMSSLHGACEAGKVEVVRELLAFVASDEAIRTELTNLKNQDGKTAFDVAVAGKQQAVCQALKDGGDANAASAACVIS
ncbi:kidins220b [Symbiodinium microadriaticum]|nr:kidins220b [Symbiodinium microadriaticum]